MKEKENRVYATHGKKKLLLGVKVRINGILCIAYMKDGEVISYEPWEDLQRQMLTGPCMTINA